MSWTLIASQLGNWGKLTGDQLFVPPDISPKAMKLTSVPTAETDGRNIETIPHIQVVVFCRVISLLSRLVLIFVERFYLYMTVLPFSKIKLDGLQIRSCLRFAQNHRWTRGPWEDSTGYYEPSSTYCIVYNSEIISASNIIFNRRKIYESWVDLDLFCVISNIILLVNCL